MISYDPLWETLEKTGTTTYYLRNKGGFDSVGSGTIRRIKRGQSISTNTIDSLCKMLHCTVSDIIEFRPDPVVLEEAPLELQEENDLP